jgi:hypothetical protein
MAGLLELLLGKENPLAQYANENRHFLGSVGAGIAQGTDLNSGLAKAAMWAPKGRLLDFEAAEKRDAKAKEETQRNMTLDILRNTYPDLAQAIEAGGLTPQAAWAERFERDRAAKAGVGGDPYTLSPGEVRYDANNQPVAYGGEALPDPKDAFNMEKDLTSQYLGMDPVKTYQAVRNGYERVRASAKTNSGPGDISMIFAYMKMLDPTSVVREGEFATAENAGGVGAQVSNLYNRLLNGERLTPELRKQFLKAADNLYQETSGNLSDTNTLFTNRAGAWNVDPSRFVLAPEAYDPIDLDATDPLGLR